METKKSYLESLEENVKKMEKEAMKKAFGKL